MTASDDDTMRALAARLGRRLAVRGLRMATAESCTGGWIAKALTDVAGSSEWLEGGLVTYSNAAKRDLLGVPAGTLARAGAVSEETVRAMASGALAALCVDVAVSVSGIAGPGGEVEGKPVGTVWLGIAQRGPDGVKVQALRRQFDGDREAVRRQTVTAALEALLALEIP